MVLHLLPAFLNIGCNREATRLHHHHHHHLDRLYSEQINWQRSKEARWAGQARLNCGTVT